MQGSLGQILQYSAIGYIFAANTGSYLSMKNTLTPSISEIYVALKELKFGSCAVLAIVRRKKESRGSKKEIQACFHNSLCQDMIALALVVLVGI